ncbi:50S ribosomal protein L11 [Candidatus Fokinia crypta]|uniref:Large ribosomal subunit protein uL11 n=1 Tax=Candidatus Fokinia crypta TaxID=1920990 RepID=A0ABZ0UPG8_9RICK|nr:50S ribosomal protein L11 [Candidatus Fokinia cryptica]WPX98019.1 50S ribosomal protein L11 [Candidatus Fokinia cryptica]
MKGSKNVVLVGMIKLVVPAAAATPSPPIGPALGQKGLNIAAFCKEFNDRTSGMKKGTPIPVMIQAYSDRSFKFEIKQPPVSFLLKEEAKLESGAKAPGRDEFIKITKEAVRRVATVKMEDIGVDDLEAAMKVVEGTARSMGLCVED